jgi:hypothetical protein
MVLPQHVIELNEVLWLQEIIGSITFHVDNTSLHG